jgi:hypothetical protein
MEDTSVIIDSLQTANLPAIAKNFCQFSVSRPPLAYWLQFAPGPRHVPRTALLQVYRVMSAGQAHSALAPWMSLSQCDNGPPQSVALGHEPPRRSLAAVTGLHPIPAAPIRAWGGG